MTPERLAMVAERLHEFDPEISPDTHKRLMHTLRCSEALEILKAVDLKKIPIPLEQIAFARAQYSGIDWKRTEVLVAYDQFIEARKVA